MENELLPSDLSRIGLKPEPVSLKYMTQRCHFNFRYHMGSLALGSLIITIVVFVRMVLSFIENR